MVPQLFNASRPYLRIGTIRAAIAAGMLSSQIVCLAALAQGGPPLSDDALKCKPTLSGITCTLPTYTAAGALTCSGKDSVAFIVGSKQTLACTFEPTGTGPKQSYSATITTIGLDVGVKGESTMVWTVLFASPKLPDGALTGKFVGVSADASIGVGGGANVLLGGSNKAIALQPLSVQSHTGLNLALGVSEMTLELIP